MKRHEIYLISVLIGGLNLTKKFDKPLKLISETVLQHLRMYLFDHIFDGPFASLFS
jgi:hypothetical protein